MLNQNLLLTGDDGYNITKSLRFRSSASAYLNRTPASAGNRKTWTWSGWVKRGTLGATNRIFTADDGSASTDQDYNTLFFTSSDQIKFAGNLTDFRTTTAVYRDASAWYHIVFVTDTTQATAANRFRLYVNGVEITAFGTSNNPSQNTDLAVNNNIAHYIGSISPSGSSYFDGYQAEINFVDGQALTPSSFGETSTSTGVWIPKKYTGTYGTNGFYLDFKDNSALTTSSNAGLGKDNSGNGNYWTTNNISITSGVTYDSMTDVPTLTSATAANYCVLNPLMKFGSNMSWNNGNLQLVKSSSSTTDHTYGTTGVSSGKWYWEMTVSAFAGTSPYIYFGVARGLNVTTAYDETAIWYASDGTKTNRPAATLNQSYGASYTTNDVLAVALDLDAGTITFYKNNVSQGIAYSNLGTYPGFYMPYIGFDGGSSSATLDFNFGQRPFAYTPPTGFVALNTFNLPTPTIGATASTQANKYMDVSLYTGNGSTQSITNSGSMQPDFVWLKMRSGAISHGLFDSIRGVNKLLYSDLTNAESSFGSLSAFNSNGFSLTTGSEGNTNGETYVGWQWKANGSGSTNTAGSITSTVSANTTAGFSIVTYTGTGANATVGHGLGVTPQLIFIKRRNSTSDWSVYYNIDGLGAGVRYLLLNSTAAGTYDTTYWNSTVANTTIFNLGTNANPNTNTGTYVAYCFSQVAGYSAFGSYTGNGSTDGPFVFTGFRPKYILIKRTDTTASWYVYDTVRQNYNAMGAQTDPLLPNSSSAEGGADASWHIDAVSNGFKIRNASNFDNNSSGTYIYACFAETPFKYSLAR